MYEDGILKSIQESGFLQSRFQLIYSSPESVTFKNVNGYFLNGNSMSWTNMIATEEETFNLELDDQYILFKSSTGKYLTVTSDDTLKFESDTPTEETKFNITSLCSNGKRNVEIYMKMMKKFI